MPPFWESAKSPKGELGGTDRQEKQGEASLVMTDAGASVAASIAEEDRLRAHYYRFLSRLLASPADKDTIKATADLEGDETELGRAIGALARTARGVTPSQVKDEYHELFYGMVRGELVPFCSYYLTGFLNEKPLAKLRRDLRRLGVTRAEGVREPEDHIAALCETMAGLITDAFAVRADLATQRDFFMAHLAPWAGRFFADLEAAQAARYYMPVGTIGRVFMEIEETGFEMTG